MIARRVSLGRNLSGAEKRVALPRHPHEAIAKQRLNAHLWPRLAENADLEIDKTLPQRPHVLVGLRRETQADVRRRGAQRGQNPRPKALRRIRHWPEW